MTPERTRILVKLGAVTAIAAVAAFRWWARLEPVNSDDLALFEYASDAVAGEHWLFSADPRPALGPDLLCLSCEDGGMSHQSLRIGLLPLALPILALFGRSATSYHLVPWLFSLAGIALVWWLARRSIGVGAAWAITALHAILPYELMHAGRFFVDLPAAVCLLLAIAAMGKLDDRSSYRLRGCAVGASLLWAYLMRSNAPFLLAPGLGLLFLRKPHARRLLLTAAAVFVAGWLGEQLLFVSKGFGVGYRAMIVARAIDSYTPFLPVYEPREFIGRELAFFWTALRGWPHGAVACAFVCAGLVSQAWIAFRGRSEALRLVATMGLATWGVFAYGFLAWTEDGILAAAPPSFRYLQPFFYATLLCVPAAAASGLSRLSARLPALRPALPALALAGIAIVAGSWLAADLRFVQRALRADRDLLPTLQAIERVSGGDPVEVWSTCLQGRVVSLFTGPAVASRCLPLESLGPAVADRAAPLVLRDATRELVTHRYLAPDGRRRALEASTAFERALWSEYRPSHAARRYVLYRRSGSETPAVAFELGRVEVLPRSAGSPSSAAAAMLSSSGFVHLLSRAEDSLPPELSPCDGCRFSARVDVGLDEGIAGDVVVRQHAGDLVLDELRQPLRAGENYVSWQTVAGADRYRVGVRLRPSAAASRAHAELRRLEVKRYGEPEAELRSAAARPLVRTSSR